MCKVKGFFPFAVPSHTEIVLTFCCNLQFHNSSFSPPTPSPCRQDPYRSTLWDPRFVW